MLASLERRSRRADRVHRHFGGDLRERSLPNDRGSLHCAAGGSAPRRSDEACAIGFANDGTELRYGRAAELVDGDRAESPRLSDGHFQSRRVWPFGSALARVATSQPVELDEADDHRLDERAPPAGPSQLLFEGGGGHDQGRHVGDRADARHASRAGEETDLTDDTTRPDDPQGLGAIADGAVHLARALRNDVGVVALVALAQHNGTARKASCDEPSAAAQEALEPAAQGID